MRAWQQLFTDFLTSAASTSRTSRATTSTTSTASRATTASGRSWPPAAFSWPMATRRRPDARDGLRARQPQERILRRCAARRGRRSRTPDRSQLLDHLAERGTKLRSSPPLAMRRRCWRPRVWRHGSTVVVDGNVAAEQRPGGQAVTGHLRRAADAARAYRCERAVVFEDALSGVEAGHAGGFGLVVGVDRGRRAQTG